MPRDRAAMETHRVTRLVEHAPGLKSLYVPQTFDILPGQFVNLWLPGVDEKPFSVSNVDRGELELSIKAVGRFTEEVMRLKVGDWVGVRGPCGHGFELVGDGVLVGGGIGIAPLRFLALRLRQHGLRHRLLFGVRGKQDLIFATDYAHDAELWSDDGSLGAHGLVTQGLTRLLATTPPAVIYGAGPEPMLLAVRQLAREHQIPVQLSFERYMKCGFGICGQCCMDGSGIRLCVEGPILTETQLAEITELGLPHRLASGARPSTVGRH
jgi:dihydroorotate dehydrogenase electron transfer subunit